MRSRLAVAPVRPRVVAATSIGVGSASVSIGVGRGSVSIGAGRGSASIGGACRGSVSVGVGGGPQASSSSFGPSDRAL